MSQSVDLVQQQKGFLAAPLDDLEHELIAGAELRGRIHDEQQQVAAFQRVVNLFHHAPVKRVDGLVYAGRIDENDLPGRTLAAFRSTLTNPLNAIARGLRLARDDGELFADQRVQQRRFACVGTADDGDESGAECHCLVRSDSCSFEFTGCNTALSVQSGSA